MLVIGIVIGVVAGVAGIYAYIAYLWTKHPPFH